MKRIDVMFEDREFKRIMAVKKISGKTWHDWILWLVDDSKEVKK